MPTGGKSVDNFDAGGVAAPVDAVTGVMGAAVAKDPTRGRFERQALAEYDALLASLSSNSADAKKRTAAHPVCSHRVLCLDS